jgi:glycosyltransferase involved in cell wall biosynthesis
MGANAQVRNEVAVVIPCYNAELCLERALESVLAQTYRNCCFYAIDDGSTDRTANILERYASRGVCAYQIHAGQAAARNRGIRMSASPYVAFLDADDEWLPAKMEMQVALLKEDPSIGLICSACARSEGSIGRDSLSVTTNLPRSGRLFERLVRDCFVFTPTVVVRRRCLEEVGLFDESLAVSEDFNLWLRIAARWKIAVVPEVLAIRHLRESSLSLSTDPEVRLLNGIAGLEKVNAVCSELTPRERHALNRALGEQKYRYGSFLLSRGAVEASRSELLAALALRASNWRALTKLGLSFLPVELCEAFMEMFRRLRIRLRAMSSAKT